MFSMWFFANAKTQFANYVHDQNENRYSLERFDKCNSEPPRSRDASFVPSRLVHGADLRDLKVARINVQM